MAEMHNKELARKGGSQQFLPSSATASAHILIIKLTTLAFLSSEFPTCKFTCFSSSQLLLHVHQAFKRCAGFQKCSEKKTRCCSANLHYVFSFMSSRVFLNECLLCFLGISPSSVKCWLRPPTLLQYMVFLLTGRAL